MPHHWWSSCSYHDGLTTVYRVFFLKCCFFFFYALPPIASDASHDGRFAELFNLLKRARVNDGARTETDERERERKKKEKNRKRPRRRHSAVEARTSRTIVNDSKLSTAGQRRVRVSRLKRLFSSAVTAFSAVRRTSCFRQYIIVSSSVDQRRIQTTFARPGDRAIYLA